MTISSRTPEGLPFRCPVCGKESSIEPSSATGDAPCPRCGHLLWWIQQRVGNFDLETSLEELHLDSLDVVELVMAAESELGVTIPDEQFAAFHSVSDVLRYLAEHQDSGDES